MALFFKALYFLKPCSISDNAGLHSSPIDLQLAFEKSMYQKSSWTNFIFCFFSNLIFAGYTNLIFHLNLSKIKYRSIFIRHTIYSQNVTFSLYIFSLFIFFDKTPNQARYFWAFRVSAKKKPEKDG